MGKATKFSKKFAVVRNAERSEASADRFATLAFHEEQILNDRLNLFLVVESILLVFAVEAGIRSETLKTFAVAGGCAITLCWCLAAWRQYLDLKFAVAALRREWPELTVAYAGIPQWLKTTALVTMLVVLPLIFFILWAAIYIYLPEPQPPLASS